MAETPELPRSPLPTPWDRIFGLGTRIFVWGLIAAIIYLLRPFFLLVFLTFVFAYIQAHGVEGLSARFAKRWMRAVLVFAVFLGGWVAIGIFLAPHVQSQVETIAQDWDTWLTQADQDFGEWAEQEGFKERLPQDFKLRTLVEDFFGLFDSSDGQQSALEKTITIMRGAANWILTIGSAFLLSLLFSFLIVLDLPRLTRGVQGLARTKIGFIYAEVAGSIYNFCKVLGRAMEAQFLIAICNTILTAIGLWVIGVGEGNMVFLCTVVFLCSFIPVAGVFVSSTPICIAALANGGPLTMLLAIAMILVIHAIEAYILNPRIYGHHLRMNPVLTLIILVICGKLFGPWGLILGIPVFNYVFSHAIRYRETKTAQSASG